ncbi:MAG: CooT family nickel-binding protein [Promethearchaeota archaeon]|nr:MAG: CooT family nickel-binding protein [Candidatus Lokiarchaeota archaeon]
MCEFKIVVNEPGKEEVLVTEEISYLKMQLEKGSVLLKGFGVQETVESAIIKEVNVYGEQGAVAKLFKAQIIGNIMNFLNQLESGEYSSDLESTWKALIANGDKLIEELKKNES